MAWASALNDLRNLLSDNAAGRFAYRKKVFGTLDGANTSFKSFEPKRLTNFSVDPATNTTLGVFLNGSRVAFGDIAHDDPVSGEFVLATAPTPLSNGKPSVLTATYYYQWFQDVELTGFLTTAANWLQIDQTANIPAGLVPAALHYAAGDAMRFAAMKWAERMSSSFLLEDAPKKDALNLADSYTKLAVVYDKRAFTLRDDFYKRSGQSEAPLFSNSFGSVSAVTPRR